MAFRIQIWQSFADCEDVVRPLLDAASNAFLGFDWLQAHWAHFGGKSRLLLMGLFRDETLVCFAPFQVKRNWIGVARISLVGSGLSDYLSFAGECTPENVRILIQAAADRVPGAYFHFPDILEGSAEDEAFSQPGLWRVHQRFRQFACPQRRIYPSPAEGQSPSNLRFQKRIPGYLKRLKALGNVELKAVQFDRDRQAVQELLPRLFHLVDLRHGGMRNVWATPEGQKFLTEYAGRAKTSQLAALVLFLDDIPIGFQMGFLHHRVFGNYVTAIHPAFTRFRIGHLMYLLSDDVCRSLGVEVSDFSKGDYFAKKVWANDIRHTGAHLAAATLSPLALLSLALRVADGRLRVWVRDSGVAAKIKVLMRERGLAESEQSRAAAALKTVEAGACPQAKPLRYRDFCDLPLQCRLPLQIACSSTGRKAPSCSAARDLKSPSTLEQSTNRSPWRAERAARYSVSLLSHLPDPGLLPPPSAASATTSGGTESCPARRNGATKITTPRELEFLIMEFRRG